MEKKPCSRTSPQVLARQEAGEERSLEPAFLAMGRRRGFSRRISERTAMAPAIFARLQAFENVDALELPAAGSSGDHGPCWTCMIL